MNCEPLEHMETHEECSHTSTAAVSSRQQQQPTACRLEKEAYLHTYVDDSDPHGYSPNVRLGVPSADVYMFSWLALRICVFMLIQQVFMRSGGQPLMRRSI